MFGEKNKGQVSGWNPTRITRSPSRGIRTRMKMYLGVVQDTPVFVLVAFVISTCNQWCDGEKEKEAYNERARDQNFSRSNDFRGAERKGIGGKFGKGRGIKRGQEML